MKVKIEGSYVGGHAYQRVVEIAEPAEYPPFTDTEWWHEWWQDWVFPHTGDGVTAKVDSYCEAVIIGAVDMALVGAWYEWDN